MDLIRIGSFLAELRREKGLTQQALGDRLGVTNKTISRWETGCYLPDVEMLSLLSREFGVSINELVAGERLVAEDFKKAADENLVTALDHSTFTLKEKQAFFKKKWRREHRSTIILCSVAWVALMVALRMQNVEAPLCGTVGGMLAILYYASKGRAIGGGDVKLMAVCGLVLGWKLVLLAFFLGCILGSVIHIIRMKAFGTDRVLAMGPYLSLGVLHAVLWGNTMIQWYMGLLGF